jgi:predicted ArsR family transcriptional regulator
VDVPPAADDALAQPSRARLFALLAELKRPAGTSELATSLRLHPNGVRLHLERLERAGLVVRERERRSRGRPRDVWSISDRAQPGGGSPTAYRDLGRWLVRTLVVGGLGTRDVEQTGRQIGRELATRDTGVPAERQLHAVLVAMGFMPRRRLDAAGTITYCLENCPYRSAVRERQAIVCGLHRGITRGLLDQLAPDTKLAAFVAKDPETAGCEITLRGPVSQEVAEPLRAEHP